MKDDASIEFDLLEEARRRLTRVFEARGHDEIVSERAALYVIQGVREVPRLIAALTREGRPDAEVISLLEKVFENAAALGRARAVLAGLEDLPKLH